MEDVTYYSEGEPVSAWLTLPEGSGPHSAIVFCPGYTGTKFAAFYQPYVKAFAQAGIASLLIDYRGWGESGGERGVILPLQQVEDVRNGLSYLESRNDVDAGRLGIFGVSFGGGHATYVPGIDSRVRCGVAVSGIADGEAWLREMRRGYEWQEFRARLEADRKTRAQTGKGEVVDPTEDIMIPTPERRATNVKGDLPEGAVSRETPLRCADAIIDYRPIDMVARIAPRAMLWLCVADDAVVSSDHSRRMYEAASEPKRLSVMPGNSHYGAYVEHADQIIRESTAWYGTYL